MSEKIDVYYDELGVYRYGKRDKNSTGIIEKDNYEYKQKETIDSGIEIATEVDSPEPSN